MIFEALWKPLDAIHCFLFNYRRNIIFLYDCYLKYLKCLIANTVNKSWCLAWKNICITKMKQLYTKRMPTDWTHFFFSCSSSLVLPTIVTFHLTDMCHTGHASKLSKWSLRNMQQLCGHKLIVNSDNCKMQVRLPFLISEIIVCELILHFWFLDLEEFSRNSKKQLLHVIFPFPNQ